MELADMVIVVGLALGVLMGVSASWVWLKHQRFGTGGAVLCLAGVALIGLSIYGRVKVKVGVVEAELEARIEQAEQHAELASAGVLELSEQIDVSQRQFVRLAEALEQPGAVGRPTLEQIVAPVEESVRLEPEALGRLHEMRARGELTLPGRVDPATPPERR